jgi:hypothetical protein
MVKSAVGRGTSAIGVYKVKNPALQEAFRLEAIKEGDRMEEVWFPPQSAVAYYSAYFYGDV